MKREKYKAKNGFLRNTSTDLKKSAFVILKNHPNALIRKERLSPTKESAEISLWKGRVARQSRKSQRSR